LDDIVCGCSEAVGIAPGPIVPLNVFSSPCKICGFDGRSRMNDLIAVFFQSDQSFGFIALSDIRYLGFEVSFFAGRGISLAQPISIAMGH
jgi:hypothetical protein